VNPTFARFVALTGVVTLVSGLAQMVAPSVVLAALRGEVTATSAHLFRIVGMLMALFGGLLLQSYKRPAAEGRMPVLYCGWQKTGAVAAVTWAVSSGLFSPIALCVAGFDFISAIALFAFARSLRP
jgi:uncharacterized protein YjeT (DUF2065 family)